MAQYEHLPIYKKTYDLLLLAMQATKDFPREYKYTLGQNIKDEITGLVVFIYRANSAHSKTAHIENILNVSRSSSLPERTGEDSQVSKIFKIQK